MRNKLAIREEERARTRRTRDVRIPANGAPHNKKQQKKLLLRRQADVGFGFSIRGGSEYNTGIFVSSISRYAHTCGLNVGDQILRVNQHIFRDVTHRQAVQYIQRQKQLHMTVYPLGVIPGVKVAFTEFQWTNCYGSPCSPLNDHRHTNDKIRKVNVVVGNNVRLGLLIRGGSEYGLGIFVAGIDEDSVVDRCGIMVGEQILGVNGISFTDISHSEAARVIASNKMMTMVLKDVAKIPVARVVLDQLQWIANSDVRNSSRIGAKSPVLKPGFAGTQMQHQAVIAPLSLNFLEEKAHGTLTQEETLSLKHYVREYVQGKLTVNGLALSLLDLLDTDEKMKLMIEVRNVVKAQDIETFDTIILGQEGEAKQIFKSEDEDPESLAEPSYSPHASRKLKPPVQENKIYQGDETLEELEPYSPERNSKPAIQENEIYQEKGIIQETEPYSPHVNRRLKSKIQENAIYQDKETLQETVEQELQVDQNDISLEDEISDNSIYATVKRRPKNSSLLKPLDENDALTNNIISHRSSPERLSSENSSRRDHSEIIESLKDSPQFKKRYFSPPPRESLREEVVEEVIPYSEREVETTPDNDNFEMLQEEQNFEDDELGLAFEYLNQKQDDYNRDEEEEGSMISVSTLEAEAEMRGDLSQLTNSVKFESLEEDPQSLTEASSFHSSFIKSNSFTNFQPKFAQSSYEGPQVAIEETSEHSSMPSPPVLSPAPSDGEKLSSRIGDSPTFNTESSNERRYAQFSVNDILRQDFLPTTRPSAEEFKVPAENSLNKENQEETLQPKKSNYFKLNIQNQFEYESSGKHQYLDTNTGPSNNARQEVRTYGKPVMSQFPDFLHRQQQINPAETTLSNIAVTASKISSPLVQDAQQSAVANKMAMLTRSFEREPDNGAADRATTSQKYANNIGKRMLPADNSISSTPPMERKKSDEYVTDSILSRIEAFSKLSLTGRTAPLKKNSASAPKKLSRNKTQYVKTVNITKDSNEIGFKIDVNEESKEVFVSEIQDIKLLKFLSVGNILLGIDEKPLKKGLKRGLVNLMLKNSFQCSKPHVTLTVKA